MATFRVNNVSIEGGVAVLGGLGACPQQAKKGFTRRPEGTFFEDWDIPVHTCTTKQTPKYPQNKLNIHKEQKMKKTKLKLIQKIKITTLLTITLTITSCATTNRPNKIALRMIKNNNVILKEIKRERSEPKLQKVIKTDEKLLTAEKRLLMALTAIIESNDSLKKRFIKKSIKEVQNDRR
ncbi:MAG: hypothetical protein HOO06_05190 [Bdellovibrionaceae bacterium]|jgi:hypothetical protein|nr:hypothetical protein [Pseudobdellovibrionaceae bacterium]